VGRAPVVPLLAEHPERLFEGQGCPVEVAELQGGEAYHPARVGLRARVAHVGHRSDVKRAPSGECRRCERE